MQKLSPGRTTTSPSTSVSSCAGPQSGSASLTAGFGGSTRVGGDAMQADSAKQTTTHDLR
jgi:hypothetical protein